jgi:transposase
MASHDVEELFESLPEQAAPERVSRCRPRLRIAERRQVELRAVTLDDLVPDDHRVRLVWRFVKELDLTALHATIKAVEGQPGHPPPDPRILVALWLFATIEGIGSGREVARLCQEHIAYQWLCGGVGMNAKTLGDFRIAHCAVLERLLVDRFTALIQAGVASLERVAQDGVRVRGRRGVVPSAFDVAGMPGSSGRDGAPSARGGREGSRSEPASPSGGSAAGGRGS